MANHALAPPSLWKGIYEWLAHMIMTVLAAVTPEPRPAAAPDPQDVAWGEAIRKMGTRMRRFYREQGYTA